MIKNVLIVLLTCSCCYGLAGLTDEEKYEAFRQSWPDIEKQAKEITDQIPEDQKAVGHAVFKFNNKESTSLELIKKAMSPESEQRLQIAPVNRIKINERTYPLFQNLLKKSEDSWIRTKIIWRFRKDYMTGEFRIPEEMRAYLRELVEAENEADRYGSKIHFAATSLLENIDSGNYEAQYLEDENTEVVEKQAIETSEKFTQTESATKAPAKVITSENIEESDKETLSGWFWLFGILIGLGGFWLLLRRKF
jgi:glutathione peroxidase-family protein